jgi:hypothetical protein
LAKVKAAGRLGVGKLRLEKIDFGLRHFQHVRIITCLVNHDKRISKLGFNPANQLNLFANRTKVR